MIAKLQFSRGLVGSILLLIAHGILVLIVGAAFTVKAQAQFFDGDFTPYGPRHQRDGGFFGNLFGGFRPQPYFGQRPSSNGNRPAARREREPSIDNSHAPAPRKIETNVAPTTSILVMGDGMADWLAYGLEDAFSDAPEIAFVRKNKPNSGLVRYELKSDVNWPSVARDVLAQEKPNLIMMMIGINDRQNIRENAPFGEVKKKANDQKSVSDEGARNSDHEKNSNLKTRDKDRTKGGRLIEFHSEEWAKAYLQRIDETMAILKSKGVPVIWVGLPSIRGTKSTTDAAYLNDLYRASAERAGIVFIDVWDGFVDEGGKYTMSGPDYEGQIRRLRSSDGVFFTKPGARKLAHYVEREIRRYLNNHVPVAFPSGPAPTIPGNNKPAARPLVGPVVSLTAVPDHSDTLLGGAVGASPVGDAVATQVLVKGEPLSPPRGRADNFVWSTDVKEPALAAAESKSVVRTEPAPVPTVASSQKETGKHVKKAEAPKSHTRSKTAQSTSVKSNIRRQRLNADPRMPFSPHSIFPWFPQSQ
jgi:uncharacterized protein